MSPDDTTALVKLLLDARVDREVRKRVEKHARRWERRLAAQDAAIVEIGRRLIRLADESDSGLRVPESWTSEQSE